MPTSHPGAPGAIPGAADPTLQVYVLKNLVEVDPEAIQKNLRGVMELLRRFDTESALKVLRDFDAKRVPGLGRLLLHLIYDEPDSELVAPALKMLGEQPDREQYLPELLQLRGKLTDPRALSAAIGVLGRVGRDLPFKFFKPYLRHADARVRANTLELLLDRLHPRLTEVFAVLVNDPSPRVQATAALALWRLGRPVLASLLEESEDDAARGALAHVAGKAGQDPRLATGLLGVAGDEKASLGVRRIAARSLATAASSQDVTRIVGVAFKAPDSELRRELIRSAAALDSEETSAYLVRLLKRLESPTRVRQLASTLALIGELPVMPGAQEISVYLEYPDDRVAANAAETLSRVDGADAAGGTGGLWRALGHRNGRVAANAAVALWKRGGVAAFGRLREMAASALASQRASAAWALGRIGGLLAQDLAYTMLDDPDERVRRWAFEALRG